MNLLGNKKELAPPLLQNQQVGRSGSTAPCQQTWQGHFWDHSSSRSCPNSKGVHSPGESCMWGLWPMHVSLEKCLFRASTCACPSG